MHNMKRLVEATGFPNISVNAIFTCWHSSISAVLNLMKRTYCFPFQDHGLARHAMAVYERATKAVQKSERFEVC